jgi:hypothetical protein
VEAVSKSKKALLICREHKLECIAYFEESDLASREYLEKENAVMARCLNRPMAEIEGEL